MDGEDRPSASNDLLSSPYADSYIPGGWLEPGTATTTRKRKASFDLPAPKRSSPPRLVASLNIYQTLKTSSPIRVIQRLFQFPVLAKDESSASKTNSHEPLRCNLGQLETGDSLKTRSSSEAHTRPQTTGTETFAKISIGYHRAAELAKGNIPTPKHALLGRSHISQRSRTSTLDLTAMYAEQKRARQNAFARAALLQIKQPRADQLQQPIYSDSAESLIGGLSSPSSVMSNALIEKSHNVSASADGPVTILASSQKLTPVVRSRVQSTSDPPSPSVQLFHELEASLQPVESDSDADTTAVDPSWTLPSKRRNYPAKVHTENDVNNSAQQKTNGGLEERRQLRQISPPAMGRRVRLKPVAHTSMALKDLPATPSQLKSVRPDLHGAEFATPQTANPPSAPLSIDNTAELLPNGTEESDPSNSTTHGAHHALGEDPNAVQSDVLQSLLDVAKLSIIDDVPPAIDTPKATGHAGEKLKRLTRAQIRKKQLEEEALNQFDIVPLSAEWDAKVRHAVRQGHGSYASSDLARVVPEYAGHGQDNWLNDEVINGYLNLVTAHGKKNDRPNQTPTYHAFNSFFYNNLSTKGPDSVMRWSKRPKINGTNLLNVEAVFIPINTGVHWTLAAVEPKKKTIIHYNSMRSTALGVTACAHIKKWVAKELGKDFDEENWTLVAAGESPQQTNSDDCGVFTITSARQIMLGFKPTSYRSDQMKIQRKRIVAELINNGLLKSRESFDE